ncbi:MAG TPA: radical SAM/SPASM domain-containing protein [Bryobacteraceae bacterium]|nr:radical SAM/SPASM domain-containing protein [Bryobacteraceae bacterium]
MRFGTTNLLNFKQASQFSLQSPKMAVNRLHDLAFGKRDNRFPREIRLNLANRCNFACPMCCIGQARADREDEYLGDMPFAIVEKATMEGTRHGAIMDLFGGEPTLYPHLAEVMRLVRDGRSLSFITTNGLLIKKRAKEMVDNGLNVLLISLDGWDEPSSLERGKVPGSFAAIMDGIAEIKRLRGKRPFPIIRISTAITKVNYHSIDKIAHAVYDAGVRDWLIQNYFFATDEIMRRHQEFKDRTGVGDKVMLHHIPGNNSYLNKTEVAELKASMARTRAFVESVSDMRVNFDWNLDLEKYYSPAPPSPESSCSLPYTRVDVFPDGRLALCGDGYTIGNILEGTIEDAWNSERMKEFRRVYESARIMPMCFRCCGITYDLKIGEIAPSEGRQDLFPVLQ